MRLSFVPQKFSRNWRKHGAIKRRTWRKLHLAVDVTTNEIVASVLTDNAIGDCEDLPDLLQQIKQLVAAVSADGAYDTKGSYEAITKMKAIPKIPPREGAVVQCPQLITAKYNPTLAPRDTAIRRITALGGDEEARKQWKIETGYHERSLSETAMFRRKTLFSPKLSARKFTNQQQKSSLIINGLCNKTERLRNETTCSINIHIVEGNTQHPATLITLFKMK